jgi:hypothetical protein
LQIPNLPFDSQEVLNVMTEFVCKYIGLRKLSGRSKSALQFVVEAKINVNLLVLRTVKRTRCRLSRPTSGRRHVTKKYKLCVPVWDASLLQDPRPRLLRVVQDERHELNKRFFACITLRIGLTHSRSCCDSLPSKQREKISFEHEAEDQQDQESAYADVHSTETTTATTFVSTIL